MHPFHGREGGLRSLNRARIGILPPNLAQPGLVQKTGYDLCTGVALARELATQSNLLGLDPSSPDPLRAFDRLLADPTADLDRRRRAEAIATGFGLRLGCLLLALKRGEPETRAGRPDWHAAQWAFWAGLRHIVIGGGLMSGGIGALALPAAQAVLDEHAADLRLRRSPFGAAIALVGLARCAPTPPRRRWVFDFGQTSIKRGLVAYDPRGVAALQVLPTLDSVCPPIEGTVYDRDVAAEQWARMADVVAQTVASGSVDSETPMDLAISLACYLFDGHPAASDRGCYGRLALLAPNLATWMQSQLESRLGRAVRLQLDHDGTAAARSEDGGSDTLVMTIGTALGSGFPDSNGQLLPLAEGFNLA